MSKYKEALTLKLGTEVPLVTPTPVAIEQLPSLELVNNTEFVRLSQLPEPEEGDMIVREGGKWIVKKQSIIGIKQGESAGTTVRLTIGPNPPANPQLFDIWLDTNG